MQIDGNLNNTNTRSREGFIPEENRESFLRESQQGPSFEDLYNSAGRSSFGGKIIHAKDQHGFPVVVFAVRPDQSEADELDRYFSNLTQMTINSYDKFRTLHYIGRTRRGPYWNFHFRRPEDALSLREILEDHIDLDPVWVMKELLRLVNAFGRTRRSAANDHTGIKEYLSLSCLSLDTVFCSCRDNRPGNVMILPLRSLSGTYDYPDELPREAGKDSASERTDVYSIAYLGTEISSWNGSSFKPVSLPAGLESLITRCLSPFPALRPDARAFLNDLMEGQEEEEEGDTAEDPAEGKGIMFFHRLFHSVRESVAGLGSRDDYEDDPDEDDDDDIGGRNSTFR